MKARRIGQSMLLVGSLLALCLGGSSGPAKATSNSFTAVDDSTVVTEDAPATAIDVLTNDVNDGGPETIASVDTTGTHGDVRIAGVNPRRPPNIVLFLTDDQSMESVAKMPFLESRTDWFSFSHAYLNNPVCCPARATILSGQYSHHTGVEDVGAAPPFDDRSTIATWLHDGGYHTGFFGKWHLGSIGAVPELYIPPGWDEYVGWKQIGGDEGNEAYYGYTLNDNGTSVDYGSAPQDYSTDVLADKAVDFLDRAAAGGSPFFLYFAPRAPHNPWTAAPRHLDTYKNETVEHPPDYNESDTSDKPQWWRDRPVIKPSNSDPARRKQWDTLLAVDDALKEMYSTLDRLQILRDTVIVFMTDNGFAFGEHRWLGKHCAYEECIHTPLLVWYPGAAGRPIPEPVSDVDIAPTLAGLAGITPASPVDGHSFVPLLLGQSAWPDEVLIRGYNTNEAGTPPTFWGVRTTQYKYIETVPTGEVELYDLASDPYELSNVANEPEYAETRAQLAQRLAELRAEPPHAAVSQTADPDPGTYLTYEPDPGYCNDPDPGSADTFTYTTSGGSTATVSVTVTCVDDAPVAFSDAVTTTARSPATPIDVLGNDTDADGGPMQVEAIDATRTVGSVVVTASGSVEYTPAPSYCNDATSGVGAGPDDTFDYRLNGGATATVYVTVRCVFAPDGSGTLTSPTTYVRNGSTANTLTFTYTAPAGGMVNGALSLEVPAGWPDPSTNGGDPGYFVTNTGTRSIAGRTLVISGLNRSEGQTVVITYGAKASNGPGATAPTIPGQQTWEAKSKMLATGSLVSLASSPAVNVLSPGGSGTIVPSPAFVDQSSSANTITFTYTAAAGGMVNGSLSLDVPTGWSAPSTASSAPGAVTASLGAASVAGRTITISGLTLNGGETVTIVYGSRSGTGPGANAPTAAGSPAWMARQRSSASGTLTSLAASPAVTVVAGVLHHFMVEAAGGGPVASQQAGVPFTVKISARDASNNTVTGFGGTVDIVSNRSIAGGPFTTGPFVAGVLSQTVKLTQGGLLTTLTATQTGAGVSGTSTAFTVFAADGSGTLTTPTAYVRSGSGANTLAFTYTVAAGGLSNGALSLEVPEGWSPPSSTPGQAGYVLTNTGSRSVSGRTITVSGLNRSEGQTVVVTYGARASSGPGATAPTAPGPQTWVGKSRALAGGTLAQLASSPAVNVLSPGGSGTIVPSPAFVDQSSSANTITFTYTAAAGGMVNGSLSLDVPTGWSAPSTASSAPGAVTASLGAASVAGRTITISGLTLNGGETVTIVYGSRSGTGPGANAPTAAGSPAWMARQRSSASGTLTSLAASPAVTVLPGP